MSWRRRRLYQPCLSDRSRVAARPATDDLRDAAGPYEAVPGAAKKAKNAARRARRCCRRLLPFRLTCGGIQPGPFAPTVAALRRPDVELMHEVGAHGAVETPSDSDQHRIHARRWRARRTPIALPRRSRAVRQIAHVADRTVSLRHARQVFMALETADGFHRIERSSAFSPRDSGNRHDSGGHNGGNQEPAYRRQTQHHNGNGAKDEDQAADVSTHVDRGDIDPGEPIR